MSDGGPGAFQTVEQTLIGEGRSPSRAEHNNIDPRQRLGMRAEALTNEAFEPIAVNRAARALFRNGEAKSCVAEAV